MNLTIDACETLAGDLVRVLSDRIHDPEAVETALLRWLAVLGPGLHPVALYALRHIFAECLHVVPGDQVPPGATTYRPRREHAA